MERLDQPLGVLFCMSRIEDQFQQAMDRLISREGSEAGAFAVAVSGGRDSMALVHLAKAYAERRDAQLTALTVDHGLRAESAGEAAQVADWCAALGVAHETLRWKGEKPSGNIEAEARRHRYALMEAWCFEQHVPFLMTAHHREDQAETFLIRLIRGSGVRGLSAMQEARDLSRGPEKLHLLRPLLDVSRSDISSYLSECSQDFLEDPMNSDPAFLRSRIRRLGGVLGDLGLSRDRLVSTAARISLADEVLQDAEGALWRDAVDVSPLGFLTLSLEPYCRARTDTRARVLSRLLQVVSGGDYGPRYEKLMRVDRHLQAAPESGLGDVGLTLHGCEVRVSAGEVLIFREQRNLPTLTLSGDPQQRLWDGRFLVSAPVAGEVRALGGEGLSLVRASVHEVFDMPDLAAGSGGRILASLPSLWVGDQLLGVAQIPYGNEGFKGEFILPL